MAELKTCVEELGLGNVSTFIGSRNVLFERGELDAAVVDSERASPEMSTGPAAGERTDVTCLAP